jgi:nitric oxide reductase large subunit
VMLVWNIVTAIVAIIGGAVAGVLYKPPAAEDYADGKKDKEFDSKDFDSDNS